MKCRGLLIAVVVLVILSGTLYWSQHRKQPDETAAAPTPPAPVILKVNPADVTQLVLKQKEPVTLEKSAAGKWEITSPQAYPADQEAVAEILSTLSGLNASRLVEDKTPDRKQYGLDPPVAEVDITAKGVQKLLLGDDTPAGGNAYAALASDPRVFTLSSYNKTSLEKGLGDLRDKSLLTLSPDKVSRLELLRKGQDIDFDRTKDGWQILKPSPSPADGAAVDDLVRTLAGARMLLTGPGTSDAAAQFARATPVATAKLTGISGVQTLEVRKNKDDYYAKSSTVPGDYKVDSTLGAALDKKLVDFQSKNKKT